MKKATILLACLMGSVALAQAPVVATRVELKIVTSDSLRGRQIKTELQRAMQAAGLYLKQGTTSIHYTQGAGGTTSVTEEFTVWGEPE